MGTARTAVVRFEDAVAHVRRKAAQSGFGDEDDGAAAASIATVRAPLRLELRPEEGQAAIPAVTSADAHADLVDEGHLASTVDGIRWATSDVYIPLGSFG